MGPQELPKRPQESQHRHNMDLPSTDVTEDWGLHVRRSLECTIALENNDCDVVSRLCILNLALRFSHRTEGPCKEGCCKEGPAKECLHRGFW